ncbi:cupin domain-containing protein [Novosphingobium sp. BW1]|uniref:cupin domain-containing protein n=1 Tax=Novosphingobium sp. BW1 TaxID=2592621 RepID=UPI0011DEC615|nr:cupin domain-containing protein [Novosphingobium sp. BW1]TYC80974.1 cupin domain-containing protein [Novosphingobium sp. BW1]
MKLRLAAGALILLGNALDSQIARSKEPMIAKEECVPHSTEPVSPIDPAAAAFTVAHLYGGEDGESHLEMLPLPRTGGKEGRSVQTRLYATDVEIADTLPGDFIDFHGVSTPRFLIVLAGSLEIGLGDGSKYILSKGDIVLADDVTGHGHTSRTIGPTPLRVMTVRLPHENSLLPKLNPCPEGMPESDCVSRNLSIERTHSQGN